MSPQPDPRPRVVQEEGACRVAGRRCVACRHPLAYAAPRCPVCRGALADARFGPEGAVFAATIVRVPIPGRTPPWGLAYVDLDDGPRILAHYAPERGVLPVGARVRLRAASREGDPTVALAP